MRPQPVVAVIDSNLDTVRVVLHVLRQAGFRAVGCPFATTAGAFDWSGFLARHQPDAVLFHVDPPYDTNIDLFTQMREQLFPHVAVVLTTAGLKGLSDVLGLTEALTILVKPYDMVRLVEVVREATQQTLGR
jgi:two-component SAPR family response regulator